MVATVLSQWPFNLSVSPWNHACNKETDLICVLLHFVSHIQNNLQCVLLFNCLWFSLSLLPVRSVNWRSHGNHCPSHFQRLDWRSCGSKLCPSAAQPAAQWTTSPLCWRGHSLTWGWDFQRCDLCLRLVSAPCCGIWFQTQQCYSNY